jgi:methionyl-tRNA formyltransferase
MKILFFGMPITGAPFLKGIIDDGRHPVVGVVVPPIRKSEAERGLRGRYRSIRMGWRDFRPKPGTTEWLARRAHLPIWRRDLNEREFIHFVSRLKPDLFVVASFNRILKQPVLDLAPRGVINVHPSLLPKYRGADPIFWVILNGERGTGVTVHFMDAGLDSGPILGQRSFEIPGSMGSIDLTHVLTNMAIELLLETLNRLEAGRVTPLAQCEQAASYYPPAKVAVRTIDWQWDSDRIMRLVNASAYLGGARAQIGGRWMIVSRVEVVADAAGCNPGILRHPISGNIAILACRDALLRVSLKSISDASLIDKAKVALKSIRTLRTHL